MPVAFAQSPMPTTPIGGTLLPNKTSAAFRVWAPNANAAQVLIRSDPALPYQRFPLARDPNPEFWSAELTGIGPNYQYRFNVTNDPALGPTNPGGDFERVDPRARHVRNDAVDSPGYIIDPAFPFSPFTPPAPQDYLIYQLQVGSFRGKNDSITPPHNSANFTDIIPKLPYIKAMNFNAIQLLPAGEFPTDTGEGYAPTNFFAPESAQGTPNDLCQLVEACHSLGLAVLFDVIYNHVPDDDDNLWQLDGNFSNRGGGIYFADADRSPWGWRLAADRQHVHDFFSDNAALWLSDFNGDGLRFDSLHNIYPEGGAWWLLTDLHNSLPAKFLIAEHDNPAWALARYPLQATWDMSSADNFRNLLSNPSSDTLKSIIEFWAAPHAANLVRYLLGSHDQIFNKCDAGGWQCGDSRYLVERLAGLNGRNDWTARAKARLAWALNIAMPGTPMLFMGSEIHHYGYWCPDIDQYGDHRFDWALTTDPLGTEMLNLVSDANALRQNHPALRTDTLQFTHLDYANNILAFKRWNAQGDVILTVVNISENQFDNATYGVNLAGDTGTYEEIFNSQSPQYGGWPNSGNYLANPTTQPDGNLYLRVPKLSVLIFRKR